jgi:hypothetical protein
MDQAYRTSFQSCEAIEEEHRLDARAILGALDADDRLLNDLDNLTVGQDFRTLAILGIGVGDASKEIAVAAGLKELLNLDRVVLYANEPDAELRRSARVPPSVDVRWLGWSYQELIGRIISEDAGLETRPALGLALHVAYYLPQETLSSGARHIPSLGLLPGIIHPLGTTAFIAEGPGQLQGLKAFLWNTQGLAPPVGISQIQTTLDVARIPQRPPIEIPNRWPFRVFSPEGQNIPVARVFSDNFAFLLRGNWGSREVTERDYKIAGKWICDLARETGQHDNNGTAWLDGPDALVLAGPRYAEEGF